MLAGLVGRRQGDELKIQCKVAVISHLSGTSSHVTIPYLRHLSAFRRARERLEQGERNTDKLINEAEVDRYLFICLPTVTHSYAHAVNAASVI